MVIAIEAIRAQYTEHLQLETGHLAWSNLFSTIQKRKNKNKPFRFINHHNHHYHRMISRAHCHFTRSSSAIEKHTACHQNRNTQSDDGLMNMYLHRVSMGQKPVLLLKRKRKNTKTNIIIILYEWSIKSLSSKYHCQRALNPSIADWSILYITHTSIYVIIILSRRASISIIK